MRIVDNRKEKREMEDLYINVYDNFFMISKEEIITANNSVDKSNGVTTLSSIKMPDEVVKSIHNLWAKNQEKITSNVSKNYPLFDEVITDKSISLTSLVKGIDGYELIIDIDSKIHEGTELLDIAKARMMFHESCLEKYKN